MSQHATSSRMFHKKKSHKLLEVGELVVCKKINFKQITLWSKPYNDSSALEEYKHANNDEVLLILDVKPIPPEKNVINISEYWKYGAYLVVTSSGKKGWIGSGLVVSINKR